MLNPFPKTGNPAGKKISILLRNRFCSERRAVASTAVLLQPWLISIGTTV
jgi:hypothetical protein